MLDILPHVINFKAFRKGDTF